MQREGRPRPLDRGNARKLLDEDALAALVEVERVGVEEARL
jgi:hypothetical protein